MGDTRESQTDEEELRLILEQTFLNEGTSLIEEAEGVLLKLESSATPTDDLAQLFRAFHTVKGSAAAVEFKKVSTVAHCIEDLLAVLRQNPELIHARLVDAIMKGVDLLRMTLDAAASRRTIDLAEANASQIMRTISQFTESALQGQAFPLTQPPPSAKSPTSAEPLPPSDIVQKKATGSSKAVLKIDADRIEQVMNLIGELVVIKSQLVQDAKRSDPESELLSLLDRTVRELYDRGLMLQMNSLKSPFQKLERAIRDASQRLGKPVNFLVSGADTELDRAMIERIADPLLHICRNAIDHGLEDPTERAKTGKDPVGQISVEASRSGDRVVIEVKDDGRGIDRQRVIKKALDKNLISDAFAASSLTETQVFDLLFSPGFSTASTVTDMSGRGVGLDVVRSYVEDLKGTVEVQSQLGKGSSFRIVLPLTTAITDGILVLIGKSRFVMSVDSIRGFVDRDAVVLTEVNENRELIKVRDSYIELLALPRLIGVKPHTGKLIVLVEIKGQNFGIVVDEVLGQNQVVMKGLGGTYAHSKAIAGGAILGDGQIGLVLDVPCLVSMQRQLAA